MKPCLTKEVSYLGTDWTMFGMSKPNWGFGLAQFLPTFFIKLGDIC